MGKGYNNQVKLLFGKDEEGLPLIPQKIGSRRLARIEHAIERGGCTICFPHGPETTNATWKKSKKSWKVRRKTRYKAKGVCLSHGQIVSA